jgi:hypothetical protein
MATQEIKMEIMQVYPLPTQLIARITNAHSKVLF